MVLRTEDLQLTRGESVRDTAYVLSRHTAAIGIRTGPDELVQELAEHATVPVINMLTPLHHPCQALADLMTLQETFGELDGLNGGLRGRRQQRRPLAGVARNPRRRQGADRLPPELTLAEPSGDAELTDDPEAAVDGAHAVYTDVWVSMNDDPDSAADRRRVLEPYRLDDDLLDLAAREERSPFTASPPTPGEEITAEVLYGDRQRIWDQAENRRHAQKALLELLASP